MQWKYGRKSLHLEIHLQCKRYVYHVWAYNLLKFPCIEIGILIHSFFQPNLDCGCFITHLQKDRALKAPLRIRVRPSLFATYFLIGTNRTRCMHCTARNKWDFQNSDTVEITLIFNNDTIENRQHYSCYNESYFKIGTNRAEINVMISCNMKDFQKSWYILCKKFITKWKLFCFILIKM